jgi:hypothetical protein
MAENQFFLPFNTLLGYELLKSSLNGLVLIPLRTNGMDIIHIMYHLG